jgi:hypothetical protein
MDMQTKRITSGVIKDFHLRSSLGSGGYGNMKRFLLLLKTEGALLSDPQYVAQLEMMVATLKIPLERRDSQTGRVEMVRLWTVTDRTVRTWLNDAVAGD